jgi:Recombination endonuclease VII
MPAKKYFTKEALQESRRLRHLSWLRRNREHCNSYTRKYYKKYHQRIREQARIRSLRKRYGISAEQLESLLAAVKNTCPICRHKFDNKGRKVCVDHCHKTGVIRGVLCIKCNFAEGALGTPEAVLRLYDYMKRNELFYQGVN